MTTSTISTTTPLPLPLPLLPLLPLLLPLPRLQHYIYNMEKGTATQTASSTGRAVSHHPAYMTEAELASYQASWEQLDFMTAQRLKAARGG